MDDAYPLLGTVVTDPPMTLSALLARQGDTFGAAADPALLTRLDLKPGDRITIGNAVIELRAALTAEPDKLAGGIGFGPRVLMSDAALRASGLLQPGSLVRWRYRLRLPADGIGRCRRGFDRKTGADTVSRCRLGYPHPQQGDAAARTQRRALQPVPDAGRVDRASRRRRRRRERSRKPSCAQARGDRDHEDAGRHGRRHIRRLLHADHDRRAVRHADRRRSGRGVAVCNRVDLRRDDPASGRAFAKSCGAGAVDRLWSA